MKSYKPHVRGERMECRTARRYNVPHLLVVLVANVKEYQFFLFHMGYLAWAV